MLQILHVAPPLCRILSWMMSNSRLKIEKFSPDRANKKFEYLNWPPLSTSETTFIHKYMSKVNFWQKIIFRKLSEHICFNFFILKRTKNKWKFKKTLLLGHSEYFFLKAKPNTPKIWIWRIISIKKFCMKNHKMPFFFEKENYDRNLKTRFFF